MTNSRRIRVAADVLIGYAADDRGKGIAYATIHTGSAAGTIRLPFAANPLPALDGLEHGYAAVTAVGHHLKSRGFGRVRIRVGDARVAIDLNGNGTPPKALAMEYVKVRCVLHSLGAVRLEAEESAAIRDLAARARVEVQLHLAA